MDNTWHARGTGLCPLDPRLKNEFQKITKMPLGVILVLLLFEDVADGLEIQGVCMVVRLWWR